VRRREFITLLGGAAAWSLAARAQQQGAMVVGFLSSRSPDESAHLVAAFRQGLGEMGWIENQNVTIEFRWAEGRYDRLPALAKELVGRQVAVIAAPGGTVTAKAASAATRTIPIVFVIGGDPVRHGLVSSLNRPEGNITGINQFTSEMVAKRLELLRELMPKASLFTFLVNPNNPNTPSDLADIQDAARTLGLRHDVLSADTDEGLETAFSSLGQPGDRALLVNADPFFDSRRDRIVTLAAGRAIPAIYPWRDFAAAGGLLSYASNIADNYRQAGVYAGRILRGEKPLDLPVLQPTKFELVINLKTAKALGLNVPPTLVAIADEVIE
jgi:putative ABC transport system substrate-binding protein